MILSAMVADTERRLAAFYGFVPQASACAHLVTRDQLVAVCGTGVRDLPEFQARAGVFLVDTAERDELFIGIHYDESVCANLASHDPLSSLSDLNLDAYCTLVEEISHFHLILNRAARELSVSKLELEWQGEVDKLLLSSFLLAEQAGDQHLLPLARRLFDDATIVGADQEMYWQATKHAAKFWFDVLRHETSLTPELCELLRQNYARNWAGKLEHLDLVG